MSQCCFFFTARVVLAVIFLKLWQFAARAQKTGIVQLIKRKNISDNRSVENILDKRLRLEVQPAQTNWVERTKRFVNVYLHCIVSNLKRISKISTLPPLEKFMRTPMVATNEQMATFPMEYVRRKGSVQQLIYLSLVYYPTYMLKYGVLQSANGSRGCCD